MIYVRGLSPPAVNVMVCPFLEAPDFVHRDRKLASDSYLAAKHGQGTLCPENLAERDDADRWMDWQMGTLWANPRPAFIGLIRTPPEKRDRASIAAAVRNPAENLAILDAHLAGRDYVTGSSFTMADIRLGATAYRWFSLNVERPPMPNLQAWYERLCARASYGATVKLPLS